MPNKFGFNRSLGGAIGLIALVTLLDGVVVLVMLGQLWAATAAREHSTRIMAAANDVYVAMLNQETGLRGFLITGQDGTLDPYRAGRAALPAATAGLQRLLVDDAPQLAHLAAAQDAARAWQTEVAEPAIHDAANPATRGAALDMERSGAGQAYFNTFRTRLDDIQTSEKRALVVKDSLLAGTQRDTLIVTLAATALTMLICAEVGFSINRVIVAPLTRLAAAMARLAQRDLDARVPELERRNEVGTMARAVQVFKDGLIELDRTSVLRATADTLPALVGYVDAGRRVGFLNEEFMRWFELGTGDVSMAYGRPLSEVFAAVPFPGTASGAGSGGALDAAFAGQETRFEYRLSKKGAAGRRQLEATYRPHRAPDGTVLGVVTLLTDITGRKLLELRLAQGVRELRRSNEELEQFAYVASHDLKAPLRGIENLVGWIEEDLEGTLTGDTRTNMDLLKSRVRRLEQLLDDLLAYSRAGRVDGTVDEVDTRALVAELAGLVSPPEGFEVTGAPSLPSIRTLRAPLTQVFQNLINNAIKHHDHPTVGHIRVDAVPSKGGFVEFTVTDDGPGIPEQFHERVFGMFQTLRPRDQVEGSGMGLAIVRKLVERQGGTVWLASGKDGRGLAVHFTWPRTVQVATPDADEATDEDMDEATNNEGGRAYGADGEPAAG